MLARQILHCMLRWFTGSFASKLLECPCKWPPLLRSLTTNSTCTTVRYARTRPCHNIRTPHPRHHAVARSCSASPGKSCHQAARALGMNRERDHPSADKPVQYSLYARVPARPRTARMCTGCTISVTDNLACNPQSPQWPWRADAEWRPESAGRSSKRRPNLRRSVEMRIPLSRYSHGGAARRVRSRVDTAPVGRLYAR